MSRITTRLRKLEAATCPRRPLRIVWSRTSDPAEWDRRIAEMIASGEAEAGDEFMRIGWIPPAQPPIKASSD
jgi:hypothetical protein